MLSFFTSSAGLIPSIPSLNGSIPNRRQKALQFCVINTDWKNVFTSLLFESTRLCAPRFMARPFPSRVLFRNENDAQPRFLAKNLIEEWEAGSRPFG